MFSIYSEEHEENEEISKRQLVSTKNQNLKKMFHIYFKKNSNICSCFQILAEHSQPQTKKTKVNKLMLSLKLMAIYGY